MVKRKYTLCRFDSVVKSKKIYKMHSTMSTYVKHSCQYGAIYRKLNT